MVINRTASPSYFLASNRKKATRLLENLAISVLVLLAVVHNRLVPGPLSLDVGPVLGLVGVELLELVALIVGSNVEDGQVLVATDDEGTLDDGVVVLSVDGSAAEQVLPGSLQTGVEATNQVVGHEDEGELVVVLVLDLPEGVLVELGVLPEPLHGVGLVVVGVVPLPLIKSEGGAGQGLERVLGLGSGSILLSSLGSLLLGSSLLLRLLRLLGGDVGELGGVEELELGRNGRVDGLVVDGLVPPGDVGVLLAPLLVKEELETAGDDADGEEVSQRDTLANEVGVVLEVLLNGSDSLGGGLGGVVNGLLVVGVTADQRAVPLAQGGEDLGLIMFWLASKQGGTRRTCPYVEVARPLQDGGIVLLGLAQQCGLLVLRLLRVSASLSRGRGGRSSGGVVAYCDCAELANTSFRRM